MDLTRYDAVFIGGPVWWGTYPQVMFTFFKKHRNDLKGKTVIPFTTHEGSGLADCVKDVTAAFPGANVMKGFSIYGHEVRTEKAKVEKWIKGLGSKHIYSLFCKIPGYLVNEERYPLKLFREDIPLVGMREALSLNVTYCRAGFKIVSILPLSRFLL